MLRESLKAFALKHNKLLNLYRKTFGKIKTKYYFGAQKKALQKKGYNLIDRINDVLNKEGAKALKDEIEKAKKKNKRLAEMENNGVIVVNYRT